MRNKFLTEALGWGFIITFLFIVATCSYDLGKKKGVFFRLRVGPLLSDKEARQLCHALKKRRVGCLVVKPGR